MSALEQVIVHRADNSWDVAAIMYFPVHCAFMDMLADPEFQLVSRHRKAAPGDRHICHLTRDRLVESICVNHLGTQSRIQIIQLDLRMQRSAVYYDVLDQPHSV